MIITALPRQNEIIYMKLCWKVKKWGYDDDCDDDDDDDDHDKDDYIFELLLLGPLSTTELRRCDFYQFCFKCMYQVQLLPMFIIILYGLIVSCFVH